MSTHTLRTGRAGAVIVLAVLAFGTGLTSSAAAASAHSHDGPTYSLPSDGWTSDGGFSMEAASEGPFHVYLTKSGACAGLGGRDPFLWPTGFKVRLHPAELLNAQGHVIAHEGDLVSVGGGFLPVTRQQSCTSIGQSAFNVQSIPRVVQTTYVRDGRCDLVYPATSPPGTTTVPIRSQPAAGTVQWDPGSDSTQCKIAYGSIGARLASTLVDDINAAPAAHAGVACPRDNGSEARLYFQYADGTAFGPVLVSLSGCRSITFFDSPPRDSTPKVQRDLATIAPPAWRSSLTAPAGA